MKDYSKVKYVKPSVDGEYLTKDKVYELDERSWQGGWIMNDFQKRTYIYIPASSHLEGSPFLRCDKDGNEIEV